MTHQELVADLNEQLEKVRLGGGEKARARHTSTRQAAPARARGPAARPRRAVPGALAARRARHVRRGRAGRGDDHRRRARAGPRVRDRRQRRDGQGRHLLPDDGQEAPAGAGDRAPERAAVHLPRGLRRRVPAAPGRGVPGPRALRADLLQPGDDERARHPADRGRDGLVHGGRRVRAGDERRVRDRPRAGHDLPRRPAAREGRDGGGGHRGGAGRRRPALAHVRRHRPSRRRRRPRAGDRPRHRGHAPAADARPGSASPSKRRTTIPIRSSTSSPPTCASRTTRTS